MKKLSIPATFCWFAYVDRIIEFMDEEYELKLDVDTLTPYIEIKEDGRKVMCPLDHGDVIGILNDDTNEFYYRELTKYDFRAMKEYVPWEEWKDIPY